jgi:predicted NAD/FAD-dependent oxidoreductase
VIEEPTSSEFKELLKNWQHKEWIEKWEGAFGRGRGNDDGLLMISTDENVERYVAVPAMNSLCKHLVEHELIHCHFQTRAVPSLLPRSSAGFTWKIDNTDFDWVVVSDR